MQYLLLLCVVVTLSLGDVMKKQYDVKTRQANVFFFSGVTALAASFFFFASISSEPNRLVILTQQDDGMI